MLSRPFRSVQFASSNADGSPSRQQFSSPVSPHHTDEVRGLPLALGETEVRSVESSQRDDILDVCGTNAGGARPRDTQSMFAPIT